MGGVVRAGRVLKHQLCGDNEHVNGLFSWNSRAWPRAVQVFGNSKIFVSLVIAGFLNISTIDILGLVVWGSAVGYSATSMASALRR